MSFLAAARGVSTPVAPLWLMRQAGRYLPEFRELRDEYGFWRLCRTPDLAAEVTLQPLRRFGLDAAIVFSDILAPLPDMGVPVEFAPGPVITAPVRTAEDVARLRVPAREEIAPFTAATVRNVKETSPVPVIGFAGAPLTVATYLVAGGAGDREQAAFRAWLIACPETAHTLLDKVARVVTEYLRAQIEAGADAVQLFDSWAGAHDRHVYASFGLPYTRQILDDLPERAVRVYFALASAHLLEEIATLPAEVIGLDWRTSLTEGRRRLPGRALQGNLDPAVLLGPPEAIEAAGHRVLRAGRGGAHIFNLGHGMLPQTPPDAVALLADTVRGFERESA